MIGTCIMCEKKIFKFVNGRAMHPLGNYRSIIFSKEDGSGLEAPFCADCHDCFKEDKISDFSEKLHEYMSKIHPDFSKDYKNVKFIGFKFGGALKSSDLENGVRIWR